MSHAEAIPWPPILACCADDLGGAPDAEPRVLSDLRTGASRLVFFEAGTTSQAAQYAVKLPRTNVQAIGWNAQREYDALVTLREYANGSNWMVIPPVGVSTDPAFMVTRRVIGTPLRTEAERGMHRWASRKALAQSVAWCERLAGCRRDMRAGAEDAPPGEHLTENTMITFCQARLDEVAEHRIGKDAKRLRTNLGAWIDRAVPSAWPAVGHLFSKLYPCHGDFSFQNILVDPGQPMCLVDLEGFKTIPVDIDYAKFRFRFEQQKLLPTFSPARLSRCWERFHRTVCVEQAEEPYFLLSYMHTLLALLAWAARFSRDTTRGNWRIRLRSRLWVRQRMQWLGRINKTMSVEHVCHKLAFDV